MSDKPPDQRETIERVGKFWEDVEQRAKPERQHAFEYEQLDSKP